MWLARGMGIALGRENEVGHTIEGAGGKVGRGRKFSAKAPTAHLSMYHVSHSFLDRAAGNGLGQHLVVRL